jgi:hypothetical protein
MAFFGPSLLTCLLRAALLVGCEIKTVLLVQDRPMNCGHARVMKMAAGGFRPASNVQSDTDTKSTAITAVLADNIDSAMGKVAPINDALASRYGEPRRQHLVDGGFVKFYDIETLAGNGVEVFLRVPKPRDACQDRHPSKTSMVPPWSRGVNARSARFIQGPPRIRLRRHNYYARVRIAGGA